MRRGRFICLAQQRSVELLLWRLVCRGCINRGLPGRIRILRVARIRWLRRIGRWNLLRVSRDWRVLLRGRIVDVAKGFVILLGVLGKHVAPANKASTQAARYDESANQGAVVPILADHCIARPVRFSVGPVA